MEQPSAAGQDARKPRRKWIVWGLVALAALMLLASIVIPNFLNYGARARQTEARKGLWAIYKAQQAFYEKYKSYGDFKDIGFKPDQPSRYTFRLGRSGRPGSDIMLPSNYETSGLTPDNPLTRSGLSYSVVVGRPITGYSGFTATAVANIDEDETVDAWSINDSGPSSLQNDVDDVKQ